MTTRDQIKNKFLELVSSKSFNKVRVSTICKELNIQRKLFYYYFEDKYALLNDVYEEDLLLNFDILNTTKINWREGANLLLDTYRSRGLFYKKAIGEDNNQWRNIFLMHMRSMFIRLFDELSASNEKNLFFNATFYANGWTGIIENWINNDFDINNNLLIENFYELIQFTKTTISKWE